MLALAAFFLTSTLVPSIVGVSFEPINVHNNLLSNEIDGQLSLTDHHYPLVYGTLVVIVIASTWLASRVIRHPEARGVFFRRRNLGVAKTS